MKPYFPQTVVVKGGGSASVAGRAGIPGHYVSSGGGPVTHRTSPTSSGSAAGATGSKTAPGGSSGSGGGSPAAGRAGGASPGLTPASFDLNPQAEASYCRGTSGNGSPAPGVTPTSITVGNVSGLTGPVSDSFTQGLQAVTALFDSINRYGGICGRQLKVASEDDQQTSSTDASDVQYLIPRVLALVGDLSDADNGGVPAMVAAGVPDLGPAINTNRSNSPVYWSATGGSVEVRNGRAYLSNAWVNGLRANNDLPGSIAVLSYDIPISAQAGQEFAALFQKEGVRICYANYSIPPAPGTEMGSIVQSVHSNGCQGIFTTMDVVGNADMLQDIYNDGYQPDFKLVSTTYEGYTPAQISLAGQSAAQGLQAFIDSLPLASSNAAIQLYQQELAAYEPGQAPSEFGLEAWADAQLFVYALVQSGRDPTRASLVKVLNGVTGWTTGGAFGAYTPRDRTVPPCAVEVVVRGSGFALDWPSTGLYCNGQLVDVGAAG